MKKFFTFGVALVAMALSFSCTKEPLIEKTGRVYTAYTDNGLTTKTLLNGVSIEWSNTDKVKGLSWNEELVEATASVTSPEKAKFIFEELDENDGIFMAVYPSSSVVDFDSQKYCFNVTLPTSQKAVDNSFSNGANIALAYGEDDSDELHFLNAGALVSVKVMDDDIAKIELSSTSNVPMSGSATLEFDANDLPLLKATEKAVSRVALSGEFTKEKSYYFVVFPGEYNGFSLKFTKSNGEYVTYTATTKLVLRRNDNVLLFNKVIDKTWEPATFTEVFKETFNETNGTGGNDNSWSGSIASSTIVPDNNGWTFNSCGGASQCLKLGAGSAKGSAVTPQIQATGVLNLSFKAAAWNGSTEVTTINVSTTNGIIEGATSFSLNKSEWNEYSLTIKNVTEYPQITFEASQVKNNRFFLDEIIITSIDGLEGGNDTDDVPIVNPSEDKTVLFTFDSASKYGYDNPAKGDFTLIPDNDILSIDGVSIQFSYNNEDVNRYRFFSNSNTGVINLRGYVGSHMTISSPTKTLIQSITMVGSNLGSTYIKRSNDNTTVSSTGGTFSCNANEVSFDIIKSTTQFTSIEVTYK